jgi:hypothetical protein
MWREQAHAMKNKHRAVARSLSLCHDASNGGEANLPAFNLRGIVPRNASPAKRIEAGFCAAARLRSG